MISGSGIIYSFHGTILCYFPCLIVLAFIVVIHLKCVGVRTAPYTPVGGGGEGGRGHMIPLNPKGGRGSLPESHLQICIVTWVLSTETCLNLRLKLQFRAYYK